MPWSSGHVLNKLVLVQFVALSKNCQLKHTDVGYFFLSKHVHKKSISLIFTGKSKDNGREENTSGDL